MDGWMDEWMNELRIDTIDDDIVGCVVVFGFVTLNLLACVLVVFICRLFLSSSLRFFYHIIIILDPPN